MGILERLVFPCLFQLILKRSQQKWSQQNTSWFSEFLHGWAVGWRHNWTKYRCLMSRNLIRELCKKDGKKFLTTADVKSLTQNENAFLLHFGF